MIEENQPSSTPTGSTPENVEFPFLSMEPNRSRLDALPENPTEKDEVIVHVSVIEQTEFLELPLATNVEGTVQKPKATPKSDLPKTRSKKAVKKSQRAVRSVGSRVKKTAKRSKSRSLAKKRKAPARSKSRKSAARKTKSSKKPGSKNARTKKGKASGRRNRTRAVSKAKRR